MKKYALVVGISNYADAEITDLNFAADDARDVGHCLQEICGFDEVRTLTSDGATEPDHVNIVDTLHNLAPLLTTEDLFLFYFAGHGIHSSAGSHLLTSNSRIRMPELASLQMQALQNCLSRFDAARRVLILDACRNDPHSGMGDEDNLLSGEFSRDILAVAKAPAGGVSPATCVLFSCSEGERAYEWPEQKHGAFTHYLLDGMGGAAFDDSGKLTVQELGRYVEEQVPRWSVKMSTPRRQTPWAQQVGSLREICLAERHHGGGIRGGEITSPATGTIEIESPPEISIESRPSGAVVFVDERRAGLAPLRLALPSGRYNIRAELEGYETWQRRVRFDARGDAALTIELKPAPRVHLPDSMKVVSGARYASLEGLAPGSREAQERQREAAKSLGLPLEVECRHTGMRLRLIPAGRFMMGDTMSPDQVHKKWPGGKLEWYENSHPRRRVQLSGDFYIGATTVTRGQFARFVRETGYKTDAEKEGTAYGRKDGKWDWQEGASWKNPLFDQTDDHPVVCVSHNDAGAFCRWLSEKSGAAFALPTEARWEYAARAGADTSTWYWGDDESGAQGRANVAGEDEKINWMYKFRNVRDGYTYTAPVASFAPNAFGLYDVIGNVWEWCADWFQDRYEGLSDVDPSGPSTGDHRVVRGGSWISSPGNCRSARRYRHSPEYRLNYGGFRVVMDFQ